MKWTRWGRERELGNIGLGTLPFGFEPPHKGRGRGKAKGAPLSSLPHSRHTVSGHIPVSPPLFMVASSSFSIASSKDLQAGSLCIHVCIHQVDAARLMGGPSYRSFNRIQELPVTGLVASNLIG